MAWRPLFLFKHHPAGSALLGECSVLAHLECTAILASANDLLVIRSGGFTASVAGGNVYIKFSTCSLYSLIGLDWNIDLLGALHNLT